MKQLKNNVVYCLLCCLLGVYTGGGQAKPEAATVLPGLSQAMPKATKKVLLRALQQKRGQYEVRTHYKNTKGEPKYTNRLILENSPYLLQHAHNPVNWYAWGNEAFEAAEAQNKPVFLSIGYSTCHWCHVMEEESFDNEEIAAFLNQHFICIKVDREQYPDIDDIYMKGVQLTSGRGGWPMSSFLNTKGQPFYGATYFTPERFLDILQQIHFEWYERKANFNQVAAQVAAEIERIVANKNKAQSLDKGVLQQAIDELLALHDSNNGGFRNAPKFPNEPLLFFLLDAVQRSGDRQQWQVLEKTLDAMAQGGIYDQVGGGFHRYATDAQWQVPHFEKMLYNQAQLSRIYTQAYMISGLEKYQRIARQTLDYVLRDMRSPEGAFYSATDADSEGHEGTYFVWSLQDIRKALGKADAAFAIALFGVTETGNFEGKNVLYLPKTLQDVASSDNISVAELNARLDTIRQKLYDFREQRPKPLRDEKVIAAWNGMMISSFAKAAIAFDEPGYLQAAIQAAEFIQKNNIDSAYGLQRIFYQGQASVAARQEDYAYYIEALCYLYDATQDKQWLVQADALTQKMLSLFWDKQHGGFFASSYLQTDGPTIAKSKSANDNAIASGNSVALQALLMQQQRSSEISFGSKIDEMVGLFAENIQEYPLAQAYMLRAIAAKVNGNTNNDQYAANGKVLLRSHLKPLAKKRLYAVTVDIALEDKWHINSDKPGIEQLTPTKIAVNPASQWSVKQVTYPKAKSVYLPVFEQNLALYEGRVAIELVLQAPKKPHRGQLLSLDIHLQACSDEVCLLPEKLTLNHLLVD